MYITIDILQKRGACQEYLDFFQKHYPDGVEMLYMIERGHMSYEALHWGYKWLDPDEKEVAAYWKRVAVESSEGVDESDHVVNSQLIAKSSYITDSSAVSDSEQITSSTNVMRSKYVDGSSLINGSDFIDSSTRILRGKNVTNSSDVVDSVYVIDSHGIFDSTNVSDCHTIWNSNNLTNCGFCFNCHGISNSLFCFGCENGEYLLFNKPIDKARFDIINRQFRRYASVVADMIEWQNTPTKVYNYQKHTKNIPDAFWNWVKTLPGYDSGILYALTFNPQFLN